MLEELLKQRRNTGQSQVQITCYPGHDGIRLYTVTCDRAWHGPCPPEEIGHYEILFCLGGQLRLELPNCEQVNLNSREILLLSHQHDLQQAIVSGDFQGILLAVDDNAQTGLSRDMQDISGLLRSHQGSAVVGNNLWNDATFTALGKLNRIEQPEYCVLKLAELLFLLRHRQVPLLSPSVPNYCDRHQSDVARRIHDDMLANLEQSLTIAQLAERHHISQTMLKGCFRSVYGKPIHTFLREQRMHRAAELLRVTDLSVIQVAAQVGYNSVSQFGQAFRRQYHLPPSRYRKEAVKGAAENK